MKQIKPLADRMESEIISPPVDEVRAMVARIRALEHAQQDAINAALESLVLGLYPIHIGISIYTHRWLADFIKSRINSNPLAEAQARIEVLENENKLLSCGQCIIENGLLGDEHGNLRCDLQWQLAEAQARIEALEHIANSDDGAGGEGMQLYLRAVAAEAQTRNLTAQIAEAQARIAELERIDSESESRSCPCLYATPCSERCTCVMPHSSSGCSRCCTYGGLAQRTKNALRLSALIDDA